MKTVVMDGAPEKRAGRPGRSDEIVGNRSNRWSTCRDPISGRLGLVVRHEPENKPLAKMIEYLLWLYPSLTI